MRTRFDEFCKDLVGAVMEHGGPVSREHHVVGPGLDIKKSTSVSESRIDEFIDRAVTLWERGADIGC